MNLFSGFTTMNPTHTNLKTEHFTNYAKSGISNMKRTLTIAAIVLSSLMSSCTHYECRYQLTYLDGSKEEYVLTEQGDCNTKALKGGCWNGNYAHGFKRCSLKSVSVKSKKALTPTP